MHDGAALVVDNRTGAVLAWAVAPARSSTDVDPVLVARQPGSTLKPFLYSLAMERLGWQPDTVLHDGPPRPRDPQGSACIPQLQTCSVRSEPRDKRRLNLCLTTPSM